MSPTTKPGNPDALADENARANETDAPQRSVPWPLILLGILALVFAVVIGTQVLGVLYVIAFPPVPPLPGDVTLKSHVSVDYGVDEWLYSSQQNACDVQAFYASQGAQCRMSPFQCGDTRPDSTTIWGDLPFGQHISRCVGVTSASIFAMRWQAIIAIGSGPDVPTEFRLTREMYWTGQVPPMQAPQAP